MVSFVGADLKKITDRGKYVDTLEAIKKRKSIRQFEALEVEREVIEEIIDCARAAPSAVNRQPWEFVVITDAEKRQKIAALTDYGGFIAQAPVCVAIVCKESTYYLEDGSAATENILLAATAHGLGSCWVAGDKKGYANEVLNLLGVPAKGYRLVSLVPIGHSRSFGGEPTPKRPLEDVIHWERW